MSASKFASRKFIVTMAAMIIAGALAVANKLTGEVATIFTVCVGAYNAANAVVHYTQSAKT
jgi:hypothetical protein